MSKYALENLAMALTTAYRSRPVLSHQASDLGGPKHVGRGMEPDRLTHLEPRLGFRFPFVIGRVSPALK